MRVLVVDDDLSICRLLEAQLAAEGFAVASCCEGRQALEMAANTNFDVVLLDLVMPGMSGLEMLPELRAMAVPPEVVMITGQPDVETAIEAMKLDAYDYVVKPVDPPKLRQVVRKAGERRRLERENQALRHVVSKVDRVSTIIGVSPQMRRVLEIVDRVAASAAPVLITGETGTGKGLIAKTIHRRSDRAGIPLMPINCAGIQEALLESELFGHEKGAFTGAQTVKPGLFEVVDGGTVFLDEIGEMSATMQAKLLQVLDEGHLRRVGGTKLRQVDVRILAATNRDLKKEVLNGRFRQDLFYRLNVVRVELPPLRERRDDIPGLIDLYLKRFAPQSEPPKNLSPRALQYLKDHSWPGNVREVSNVIEGVVLMSRGSTIQLDDLPPSLRPSADLLPDGGGEESEPRPLAEIQRLHILRTLSWTQGQKARAARLLGINVKTLNNKIKAYGIES
ncbi:MAG: sigma-54 dependent transcriptional regulator [Acidobacteriota bacterium]|nr:sigma-54 dependent transcriptional regulator [Acidobacteriota bacterium]MDH3522414.1 sigma-54 dependent transcriptional regulator [Acidobacteriota bacterium]